MSSSPLVSVIVPTFNRPELINDAVKSVLAQTYSNLELIVSNDGEPVEIESLDPRIIRVERNGPRGPGAARNRGLERARGKIITYLDDDDLLAPDHLERLVHALEQADFVYTDVQHHYLVPDQCGWTVQRTEDATIPDFDYDALLVSNFIPMHCIAHRREILELFNTQLHQLEDWEWLLRATRGSRVESIGGFTAFYRHFDGQRHVNAPTNDLIEAMEKIYDLHPVGGELLERRSRHLFGLANFVRQYRRKVAGVDVPRMLRKTLGQLQAGQSREAEATLRAAHQALPKDGEILVVYSKVMSALQRPMEAESLSSQARSVDPHLFQRTS